MGNVSRDARLTFIQLWTLADDEGRLRGNSRMLASLLFPYDDGEDGHALTTAKDVERWLVELEREGCIVRYQIDGAAYMQICNWLIHQKIDKPSKSKIPPFDESSRILAKPREVSSEEGIKDQGEEGKGEDQFVERRGASHDVDVVKTIFEYWQKIMVSPRAQLDDKRKKAIKTALKLYEPRQLCEAILGCSKSDFHMARGEYLGQQKHNGLGLIFRDADHIDKFIGLASKQATGPESIEQRNARILAELMAEDATSAIDPDVIDVDMEEVEHAS
ncbi:hypothetical protein [Massilia rhizosphaerae]|uniref:hypothetical protein n=1 Tax=Massilia rhizosphaerae TaxID=2784389 RepID=UPI0018DCF650|nr:hypothetical protein [Massilia rhizosphaerae]